MGWLLLRNCKVTFALVSELGIETHAWTRGFQSTKRVSDEKKSRLK